MARFCQMGVADINSTGSRRFESLGGWVLFLFLNRTKVVSALFFAAPFAAAQEELKIDLPGKLELPAFRLKHQDPPRIGAIESTLVAMNDGNEVGMQVVEYLKEAGVKIEFRKQAAASAIELKPKAKPVITLREGLPLYPRILASYITREASKLMLDQMVDSAEKEYMKLSMTVRVWLELGGSPRALPEIETINHFKDSELAESFMLWLEAPGSEMTLDRVGNKTGMETIPVMQDRVSSEIAARKPGDPTRSMLEKLLAGLEEDNRRFVAFLIAEHDWRWINEPRIR
ncbi:MAG: hypothetical protein HY748_09570 [Elusimicrobia bacterium]|nr:hypothetical protein [Elusimicrobiota bacterium]